MTPESFSDDAELLERYAVDGDRALQDPEVAAFLAANPELQRRLERMLVAYRRKIAPDTNARPGRPDGVGQRPALSKNRPASIGIGMFSAPKGWRQRIVPVGIGMAVLLATFVGLSRIIVHDTPAPARRYVTPAGKQATITLADGSQITLAPATTLVVDGGTGSAATHVTVSGAALFNVVPRANRPFIVQAGTTVARVLGTTFTIRRYSTDRTTRVVVEEGRVAVGVNANHQAGRSANTRVLTASMLGVVSDSGIMVMPNIAVDDYTALSSGRLVFKATPASDVVTELNRVYDLDIRLADPSFGARKLTATIPVARWSAEGAVAFVTGMLDATYTRDGRIVTIMRARTVAPSPRNKPFPPLTLESHYGK